MTSSESTFEHSFAAKPRPDIDPTGQQGRFASERGGGPLHEDIELWSEEPERRAHWQRSSRADPVKNTHAPATQLPMSTCRHPRV
jgi:hypothetical protein